MRPGGGAPPEEAPLVSVVTPVYNTERYLPECIESVLAQSYRNWEHVIVDNRSTDRSLGIARDYARRDPRIRVHEAHEFVGVVANCNRAFGLISPDSGYVKGLAADDWLFPECLERMVRLAQANPRVGVVCSYRLLEEKVDLDGLPHWRHVVPGPEMCRRALLGGGPYLFGSMSSTMFRSDLVRARRPFYNPDNLHADQEACFDVLQESDFGFVHQVLTYTRRHNEAVTSFARRNKTKVANRIMLLARWGPVYLTRAEFQRRLAARLLWYAGFLAANAHRLRLPGFREYHGRALRNLAAAATPADVGRGIALQVARQAARAASTLPIGHPGSR